MKHLGALAAGALAMLALGVGSAAASNNFAADGAAHEISTPSHTLVFDLVSNTSNASPDDDYSYLTRPAATGLTLAGITNLSTDYYVQAGNCGGGAPRFSVRLSDGRHVVVYIGDAPNFTCSSADHRWVSTGNLTQSPDLRVDTSQVPGGTFYDSWSHALALAGGQAVDAVSLVVDGGWAVGGTQDVMVDNAVYNDRALGQPADGAAAPVFLPNRHHVWDLDSNTGNASTADDFSALIYTQKKKWTMNDLNTLSTDYYVNAGGCGGGSPRFQVGLDTTGDGVRDKNVFVYVGDAPSFSCASAFQRWTSTGNVTTSSDARVDTSQLPGGTFYDTWSHAKTLAGSASITNVTFAVDAGWAFGGDQDVWVDDLNVNGATLG
jgi:hypothetical protein